MKFETQGRTELVLCRDETFCIKAGFGVGLTNFGKRYMQQVAVLYPLRVANRMLTFPPVLYISSLMKL